MPSPPPFIYAHDGRATAHGVALIKGVTPDQTVDPGFPFLTAVAHVDVEIGCWSLWKGKGPRSAIAESFPHTRLWKQGMSG